MKIEKNIRRVGKGERKGGKRDGIRKERCNEIDQIMPRKYMNKPQ